MASKLSSFPLSTFNRDTAFARLESVAGIRAVPCPSLPDLNCPFCASTDIAVISGEVSFTAAMGGEDLFNGKDQPLVTVVCSKSHFFFLREEDLFVAKSVAA